jgi:outer membrane protein OmpA-like peptidoglycan-associated protein
MARKIVGPLMLAALVVAAAPGVIGCQAHAEFGSSKAPPPPPPPAPPPAPAATPAPAAAAEPAPAVPAESHVTMKDGKLSIPGNIVFETGQAIIRPESEPTLQELKLFMDKNPSYTRIRIEGHTDNVGKSEDNLQLSEARALAVVQWLADHGIPRERCLAVGFGDRKPIADNASEAGRSQNRRTEFHIAEVAGKPFLGRDETGGGTMAPGQAAPPVYTPKTKK